MAHPPFPLLDTPPPDGLRELLDGERVGFVLRNVFPESVLQAAVARLEDRTAGWSWTPQQTWDVSERQFVLLGQSNTPNVGLPDGPERGEYLDAAVRFRADAARVFGDWELEEALVSVASRLAGGRPVEVVREGDGRPYMPATIRRLPPGTAIPLHCGGFFLESGGYDHLRELLDARAQISWFVPLQTPDDGGVLQVGDLAWGAPDVPRLEEGFWDADAILAQRRFTPVRPRVGDMVVFDGGRWFHHVEPIRGARTRWTVGGFLGLSADRTRVLYWN